MDMPFQPPLFDPLEEVENSITQPIPPEMEVYADPLSQALNAVEHSIENQQAANAPLVNPLSDPLHETLDRLEADVEQGGELPELKPEHGLPGEITTPPAQEDLSPQMKFSGPASKPSVPDHGQMSFTRQHLLPIHRMSGTRTGSRNSDGGLDYCELQRVWISAEDCDNCNNFEANENTNDGRCRHLFVAQNAEDER